MNRLPVTGAAPAAPDPTQPPKPLVMNGVVPQTGRWADMPAAKAQAEQARLLAANTPVQKTAQESVIGNAPPWLTTSQAGSPGGPVTLTNVGMEGLPSIDMDFIGAAKTGADAAYKGATQYFDEDFGRDRSALETDLANKGFAVGTEAYNNELSRMERGQNAARENAAFMAQSVGHQQAGDLLQRALLARQSMFGERNSMADRLFAQSMGVAGLGLEARGQDKSAGATKYAAGASASASNMATKAGLSKAQLDAELALRRLGLDSNSLDFNQAVTMANLARGGVNMPNFGAPLPLDVGGANQIASNNANNAANINASNNAALYGLGAAALGGAFKNYGGYG